MLRKIWLIAYSTLLRTGRDKKTLALLLLFPLIVIGILGNALQGMMAEGRINPFAVVVVNADQPVSLPAPPGGPAATGTPPAGTAPGTPTSPPLHFGQMLVDEVLGSEQVLALLKVTAMTDLEQARRAVSEGKAVAAIHVPADFTAAALAGRPTAVQLITDPGRPTQADIVAQIVGSFTEGIASGILIGQTLGPEHVAAFMGEAGTAEPVLTSGQSGIRPVSAMQYYAAAMAIMFMMMTALGQARVMIQERQDGTMNRILVSPTGYGTVLAGQILGTTLLILAQFGILAIGTRYLYGVHWGAWFPALLLGAAFSLAASGVGIATASILNDPKAADAAVGIVGNIFAALSGAMLPLYLFPATMKLMAKGIPNYWALQGFLDQMADVGLSQLWLPVLVLVLIGTVAGALGTWRLAATR